MNQQFNQFPSQNSNQPKKSLGSKIKKFFLILILLVSIIVIIGGLVVAYLILEIQKEEDLNLNSANVSLEIYENEHQKTLEILNKNLETKNKEISETEKIEPYSEEIQEEINNVENRKNEVENSFENLDQNNSAFYELTKMNLEDQKKILELEVKSLETEICGNREFLEFLKISSEIKEVENSFEKDENGTVFVKTEDAEKFKQMSEKYLILKGNVEEGISCFEGTMEIGEESQGLFEEEKNRYQTYSEVYLEASENVDNIEKLKEIGNKINEESYLVYFEATMPEWLETNKKLTEESLEKLKNDYQEIQNIYTEKKW